VRQAAQEAAQHAGVASIPFPAKSQGKCVRGAVKPMHTHKDPAPRPTLCIMCVCVCVRMCVSPPVYCAGLC
jgi:hypothetical protein